MSRPQPGAQELIETTLQRYQRVLAFSGGFARARRKEFGLLWLERGKAGPKAEEFVRRVDALAALVEKGELFLKHARGQPAMQALATLNAFDLDQVTAATRGLEGLGRWLKQDPQVQAVVTGALQPKSTALPGKETGKLVGLVKGWLAAAPSVVPAAPRAGELAGKATQAAAKATLAAVRAAAAAQREAAAEVDARSAPEPRPLGPLEQKKLAFDAAIKLVAGVLERVTPRLKVVGFSLEATGLPGKRKPWPEVETHVPTAGPAAGLQPPQIGWALMLAELFYEEMRAVQLAHTALTQLQQARLLLLEAKELQQELEQAPEPRKPILLDGFHVGKFKATAFPLSHLHLTFKGLSPLQDLFPPPPTN